MRNTYFFNSINTAFKKTCSCPNNTGHALTLVPAICLDDSSSEG